MILSNLRSFFSCSTPKVEDDAIIRSSMPSEAKKSTDSIDNQNSRHLSPLLDESAQHPNSMYKAVFPAFDFSDSHITPAKIAESKREKTLVTEWRSHLTPEGKPLNLVSDEQNKKYGSFMSTKIEHTAANISLRKINDYAKVLEDATQSRLQSILLSHGHPIDKVDQMSINELRNLPAEDFLAQARLHFSDANSSAKVTEAKAQEALNQYRNVATPMNHDQSGFITRIDGRYAAFDEAISHEITKILNEHDGNFASKASMQQRIEPVSYKTSNGNHLLISDFGDKSFYQLTNENAIFRGFAEIENSQIKTSNTELLVSASHQPGVGSAYLEQAAYHYHDALNASDKATAVDSALRGYWNTINVGTNVRGSAAISEYALRSILLSRGIDLPNLNIGKPLDLYANLYPENQFLQKSHELFENSPF